MKLYTIKALPCLVSGTAFTLYVALSPKGEVIGHAQVCVTSEPAGIRQLFVDPMYRRSGVGRALIKKCEALAQFNDRASVALGVSACDRPLAHPFYEKLGFSIVGEEADGELILEKRLGQPSEVAA